MARRFSIERVSLSEANAFVLKHHRHHKAVVGHLFSIGAAMNGTIVGVAIVGRPVARGRDVRFSTGQRPRRASRSASSAFGTYILASEPGVSLAAAGWRQIAEVRGRSWSCASRPRVDDHPLQDKLLFERDLAVG